MSDNQQPTPLTPDEFAVAMKRIADSADTPRVHRRADADSVMRRLLELLGYGEGIAIYRDMVKGAE